MFQTPQRKKKIRDSNNKGPYAPGFQMPEDEANVVDGTDVVVRNKKAISLLDSDSGSEDDGEENFDNESHEEENKSKKFDGYDSVSGR
jgi:hypothetical protein